ncbi:hypothetical protein CLOM_g15955 [Closterium sp. NIES-68]|nr:hypothetical protein CLOM_g15955 [Closterium sp. NIES-68]
MNERGGDANGRGAVAEKTSEPPPSKVEALDGCNYEEWSGRMRSAFKCYKPLKIAVGEEKLPEEDEARERWIEKNAVLFDLILQSVNKEMFEYIKDLVEADDSGPRAWKLLRDVIQPNTLPMVVVLEKELAAISMRPGDNVKPVLDKIKDTYARMAAAVSSVSQLQQCTKIISVLLRGMELQGAAEEEGVGEAEAVGGALAEVEAEVTIMRGMGAPVAGGVVMHPLTHWVIDSGCTSHMTPRADLLDEVKPPGKIKYVAAASGALLPVIGVGNAKVKGANGELVGLGNVLLVEGLSANLLSVRRLQKSKTEVTFGPTSCRAKLGKKVLWSLEEETSCIKDLWQLPIIPWNGKTPTAATAAAAKATAGGDATAPTDEVLEAFKQEQQTHVWVYPLKSKGEVAVAVLKEWMPRAQRECGHKVKVIRSDNGGEFIGADFEGELKRKGIQHQLTVPYNPQQNGVAERAFGCMVVFHVPKEKRGKLEASGRWGVHLGIAKDHKGWLLWDLTTQKLTVSRDVKFLESLYYKEWKQQQQKLPSTPLIVEVDEVQRPSRQRRADAGDAVQVFQDG